MRRLFIVTAAALAIGGCASSEPETTQVELQTFNFQPGEVTIGTGDSIVWLNQDRIHHTVTAGTPEEAKDMFDIDLFDQGQTGSYTFDETGEYEYFCVIHPHMQGVVKVVDS